MTAPPIGCCWPRTRESAGGARVRGYNADPGYFFFLGFLTSFFGLLSLAMCDPPLQMDYNRSTRESAGRKPAKAKWDRPSPLVVCHAWGRQGRKTNVGQVGNLRGGWLPPPVHREGGRGRLPIGRRLPTCPTKSRPPTDARSVFHGISRAEGPFKQTTQGDGLSHRFSRHARIQFP